MRLLLVTQDFPPVEGGMARYYADLAAGLGPEEIEISTVAAVGPGGPAPAGLTVRRMPFPLATAHRPIHLWRWRRQLAREIDRDPPDLILCGNLRPLGPLVADAAAAARRPWRFIVHGNDLLRARRRWSGWRRLVWTRTTGRAEGWIANSGAVERLGVERCGLPAERAAVLRPEVDTRRFRPADPGEAEEARREFGLPAAGPLLLFVGRLVERKGLDRLIDALARRDLWPEGTPPHLAVAGFGDSDPWRARAAAAGLPDRVHFLGAPDDARLPRLYRASDLAVVPSRTELEKDDVEGFGIVALEAQASGLPVVAGRSGGLPEAVADGESGLIVDAADVTSLAAALNRLTRDPEERRRLGEVGRRRTVESFGPGSMARRLRGILKSDRR